MQGHHILITGASGFVGTALTGRLLDEGAQVTTILATWEPQSYFVSSGMIHHTTNVVGSIEDYDTVQRTLTTHEIDTVIHLAAVAAEGQAFQWPRQAFEVNIRGPWSPRRPPYTLLAYPNARRGGLRGAGGISTDSKIVANIDRGCCPKNRSAAVVPSDRVRKKLCIAV